MSWLLHPGEVGTDSQVGGKAAALAALDAAGLPVPPWCVLLPGACLASCPSLATATDVDTVQAILATAHPSAAVLEELQEAVVGLCPPETWLVVRSSAVEEDSTSHSFAGQLESFLYVSPTDVAARVADVWRSAFSVRVLTYRREACLDGLPPVPAVIVQRLIEGEVSGVAFSADPVSGRRGITVVNAVWGLGNELVAGELDADTWHVDRAGKVRQVALAEKRLSRQHNPVASRGAAVQPVAADLATGPCMESATVAAVARLARNAECHFGRPQDIEWTWSDGSLFLLQSRPITTLGATPDPDGVLAIWDNSNVIESYGGVTTPFTFSFARRAYASVYRNFAQLMGVPAAKVTTQAQVFACLIGLLQGRVYYNLLNGYRVLALLPGFRRNSAFIEQMLGIRGELPASVAEELTANAVGSRIGDLWHLLRSASTVAWNYLVLERRVRRFIPYLDETLHNAGHDLSRLRPDELVARYRYLEERLLEHWDAPVLNDFYLMIFHGVLGRLCRDWIGDAGSTLRNDLLCGEQQMIGREMVERVRAMANMAAGNPAIAKTLASGNRAKAQAALARLAPLQEACDAYLADYGERCVDELKLECPTLNDDPLPLWRSIGSYAQHLSKSEAPPVERGREVRSTAETRVATALAGHPLRRRLFYWILSNTRKMVCNRENLRFQRTRGFGIARRIAVELGRRLVALDRLDASQDIFYLAVEEVLALIDGTALTTNLAGLVALRRAEFAGYQANPEPARRFATHGLVYVGTPWFATCSTAAVGGDTLQGIGCCRGVVRGPVRIVRDPASSALRPGEILVAERTDPGWVMVFPAASGLLVERGSVLSHSAIVARELGLPTVVALEGLTAWLEDGAWVEMDGATGSVSRVAPPGADAVNGD